MSSPRGSGRWTPRLGAVILACAALAGCGRPPSGVMVPLPPPRNWQDDLLGFRKAKDDLFKRSPDTPLQPSDVNGFEALDYWPPDPRYYFAGPINRYPDPQRLTIITTAGQPRPAEKYGWIAFPVDGQEYALQVYRLLDNATAGDDGLLIAFYDATSGKETYPAGRYIDLTGAQGGPYVLDFNRAYNPSCAYGAPERFACPKAPAENRLPIRVEVGERGYKLPSGPSE